MLLGSSATVVLFITSYSTSVDTYLKLSYFQKLHQHYTLWVDQLRGKEMSCIGINQFGESEKLVKSC